MQEQSQQRRPEEKQGLHDSERKACLQHGARLFHVQRKRVIGAPPVLAERAERDPDGAAVPVRAVCASDEAELIDSGNEGAEEEKIDESDENGGIFGGFEADQCVDGPEDGNGADDEEDQDVRRGQHVGFDVAVNEPSLRCGLVTFRGLNPVGLKWAGNERTSMPTMGIRKVISTMRLKMKKTLPIILTVCAKLEEWRPDLDRKNAEYSGMSRGSEGGMQEEMHLEKKLHRPRRDAQID